MAVFEYGAKETGYLKSRDRRLGRAIDAIGTIERGGEADLFKALMESVVGQQISSRAAVTVWGRIESLLKDVTPDTVAAAETSALQQCGISHRKTGYLQSIAGAVREGRIDLDALHGMGDGEVVTALSSLPGVGTWTAEMLMLFSMCRPDILSYGDLAIRRGMEMLYGHKKVTREQFARYRRRYSPFGSVASLYLWAVAGGQYDLGQTHECDDAQK